jgi:CheY-like chemotaxis protein
MVLLVIDDNPADLHLLTLAWAEAGFDSAIPLHSCFSSEAAMKWLASRRGDELPRGILADLMLFDQDGIMAIEILQKFPHLAGIPLVTWSGVDAGRSSTDRIAKSGVRMWKKPPNWQGYATFVRRLMNLLHGSSSASSSRLPIS